MRDLVLFVLLLISSNFYAQEEINFEGFYDHYFYEKEGNEVHGPISLEFSTTTKNIHLLDTLKTINNWAIIYVKLKGTKKETNSGQRDAYSKIIVNEIIEIDTNRTLWKFIKEPGNKIIEKEIEIKAEGFYVNQFEGKAFFHKEGDGLYGPSWTDSDKNLQAVDSLRYVTNYHWNNKGMYVVAKGVMKTGSPWGYGHYGGMSSAFTMSEIIFVDSLRTMDDYLLDNIERKGYVIINDTLTYPNSFELKKNYTFKWREKSNDYKLSVKRLNNTTVQFSLDCYKKNRLKYSKSGEASLEKYFFKTESRNFERNDYICKKNRCEFTISVHDNKVNNAVVIDFVVWKNKKMIIGTDLIKQTY